MALLILYYCASNTRKQIEITVTNHNESIYEILFKSLIKSVYTEEKYFTRSPQKKFKKKYNTLS